MIRHRIDAVKNDYFLKHKDKIMKKTSAILAGIVSFFCTASLFADAADGAPAQGNFTQTLVMIGVALMFFYFILWRPEQKRKKLMNQQRSGMKPGDKVTAMGIIGTIAKVQDATVILKMVDGAKIEVLKAAITDVQPSSSEAVTTIDSGESK